MIRIFFDVLEVNIAVSVIILVLSIFAGKLRKRYGAKWMKAVWLLLAVRLLIPYNFSMPFTEITLFNIPGFEQEERLWWNTSINNIKEQMNLEVEDEREKQDKVVTADQMLEGMNEAQNDVLYNATAQNDTEYDSQDDILQNSIAENAAIENVEELNGKTEKNMADKRSVKVGFSYSEIMAKIWIAGICVSFLYFIFSYFFFYQKCRKGLRPVTDKKLRKRIAVIQKKIIGKARIPIYQSRSISSPMLTGVFCPKLVIPTYKKEWEDEELEMIMAHELCHYKSKDLFLKFFMVAVWCFNWFNPTVFLLKKQFFYDMELACDESVLRERNGEERETYARIMLSFAGRKNKTPLFSTGFWENKKQMKKRIDYMLDIKGKRKGLLSIAVTGMLIVTISAAVSCGYKPEETDSNEMINQSNADESIAINDSAQTASGAESSGQQEEQNSFDYNHEYNEMIRYYEGDVYLAREDGIYCQKGGEGEEGLVFENSYKLRRGMELYQNSIYFCGSMQSGEEEQATIYRLHLDTMEVENALAGIAMSGQTFDALYNISIYENKLYVADGYEHRIGFELDQNGEIISQLDETADDFLYKEYNDYMALELKKMNTGFDSEEYWSLVEEQNQKYQAVMDVASCKELLQGKQVASQYKDELLSSIYLENEDGTYDYLCDAVGFPMIVTETGIYYAAGEDGEIWYADFEIKHSEKFFAKDTREWSEIRLVNYDADYVYVLQRRDIGYDPENNRVMEMYLIRVPRQGGEAQKIYCFEDNLKAYGAGNLMMHCGVYSGQMYFDDHETISINPDIDELQRLNSGELSEDAAKMEKTAKEFASAYFQNDTDALRSFLSEDFEGSVELYPYPENADKIENTHLGGLPRGNVADGVCCHVSYEFAGHAEADEALTYLSLEMIKTELGWKIKSYWLEM